MQTKYHKMVNRDLVEDICREVLRGKDKIEAEDLEALESAIKCQQVLTIDLSRTIQHQLKPSMTALNKTLMRQDSSPYGEILPHINSKSNVNIGSTSIVSLKDLPNK